LLGSTFFSVSLGFPGSPIFFESFAASVSLSAEQPEAPSKPKLKRTTTNPRINEFTASALLLKLHIGCRTTPVALSNRFAEQSVYLRSRDSSKGHHSPGNEILDVDSWIPQINACKLIVQETTCAAMIELSRCMSQSKRAPTRVVNPDA
jgi:hypothetical protein